MVYVFFALNAPCGASSYYINKIDIMRKELYKTGRFFCYCSYRVSGWTDSGSFSSCFSLFRPSCVLCVTCVGFPHGVASFFGCPCGTGLVSSPCNHLPPAARGFFLKKPPPGPPQKLLICTAVKEGDRQIKPLI